MEISEVFKELDILLKQKKLKEAEELLLEKMARVMEEKDTSSLLAIMSELIGLYRVTNRHDESVMLADKSIMLAEGCGIENTESFATILINAATANRAAGAYSRAKELFNRAENNLKQSACNAPYKYASLYNNISLLCQELEEYREALEYLKRALDIVKKLENCEIEQATTYTNMALMEIKLGLLDMAEKHLIKALNIFEADKGEVYKDSHYGAALAAMGDLYFSRADGICDSTVDGQNINEAAKKLYTNAMQAYQKAMNELEHCYGRNSAYELIYNKYIEVYNRVKPVKGLELSKRYYEEYGRKMIKEKFPKYEDRIAVGLCGYGSECFGLDDALSTDHDFGPGFCMWLMDEDYEAIGEALQAEYDKLQNEFLGFMPRKIMSKGNKRVGVLKINDFYREITGRLTPPEERDFEGWCELEQETIAAVTNGEVFKDDLGVFSWIRNTYMKYYPEKVRRLKLAEEAALIAQTGQYNYARCIKRQDDTGALMAFTLFIEHTLKFIFLLEKKYMPYYKLAYRAFEKMANRSENKEELLLIAARIKKLTKADYHNAEANLILIEEICGILTELLRKQHLSTEEDVYMEKQAEAIISQMNRQELITAIVKSEWDMFQHTENEGTRASCQNNFPTFNIMRSSQFMAWNDELLDSYNADLREGMTTGRNLITEKYARMMESTAPQEYIKLKDSLPEHSCERKQLTEQIIGIQVGWLEEFSDRYPKLSKQIRYIHTSEDTPYDTSAETYLRGELGTYSERTFILYGKYVLMLAEEGNNLNMMIMENTARLYGYASLEEAEAKAE